MSVAVAHASDDETFRKWLIASVLFHIVLFSAFSLKLMFWNEAEPLIYQSAVRVDLVGLPDKSLEQAVLEPAKPEPVAPAPVAEPTKTKEIPKKENPKLKDKVDLSKKKSALERLKALQKLEAEKDSSKAKKDGAASKPIRGNVISAGTALRGISKLEYDDYIGSIDSKIKANWQLPEWLAKAGLRARALVYIDEKGFIKSKKLVQSSGNSTYDSLTLEAIDRSAPFPAPPEKFIDIVGVGGIQFQFPD